VYVCVSASACVCACARLAGVCVCGVCVKIAGPSGAAGTYVRGNCPTDSDSEGSFSSRPTASAPELKN